ncbi:DNA replication protein DnaC [Candidatus Berkelbacteria bacterium]|nr:DNA replication protein DnaC [Candidatus Berkelbacteria bacterium]
MEAYEKIQANPTSLLIYETLLEYLNTLGEYSVEKKKSSLHIVKDRAFLGVHPRSNGLLLNIVTAEPIVNRMIRKTEQVSANRYHNELLITDKDEINGSLKKLISKAYEL